ncbi:PPE family protein [Mycobacterium sp. TY815]|uniref:PPE family protein n=1 Tax=Mycobacterium sp. TY815 TaxID=3050581 RepID=UPI002740CD5D|nr:PPE family protein [Mycobacterium sp. TY815]MDP7702859.1 PPE family protein [Mycobacterium sp. TY815]
MDYGQLPPEIHSARMYSGPGAQSLLDAAVGWSNVAEGLEEAADGFRHVAAKLNCGWQGTAAVAMTQAATPYLGWLNAAAAKSRQTAEHARAAAAAYQEAYAAMVPPPVVAANRSHRASLAAANALSQDTQTIAEMDAHYEQMWARDVEAMYTYAESAAAAAQLAPFTSGPLALDLPVLARQGALGDPDVMAAGSQLISSIPQVLQSLSASPLTSLGTALATVSSSLAKLSCLAVPVKFPMHLLNFLGKGPAAARKVQATVQATWGRGMSVGRLSVPPAWGTAEPPKPAVIDLYCSRRRLRTIGGLAVSGSLVYS